MAIVILIAGIIVLVTGPFFPNQDVMGWILAITGSAILLSQIMFGSLIFGEFYRQWRKL